MARSRIVSTVARILRRSDKRENASGALPLWLRAGQLWKRCGHHFSRQDQAAPHAPGAAGGRQFLRFCRKLIARSRFPDSPRCRSFRVSDSVPFRFALALIFDLFFILRSCARVSDRYACGVWGTAWTVRACGGRLPFEGKSRGAEEPSLSSSRLPNHQPTRLCAL